MDQIERRKQGGDAWPGIERRRVSPAVGDFALEERAGLLARIEGLLADVDEWQTVAEQRAQMIFPLKARIEELEGMYRGMILQRNAVALNLKFERDQYQKALSAVRPTGKSVLQRFTDTGLVEFVATVQCQDIYDEREGCWLSAEGLGKLNALPAGTQLYAVRPRPFGGLKAEVLAVDELVIPDDGRDV